MTSFDSIRVRCPSCQHAMRDYALASANYIGWVQWSDGFGRGRLYRPESRVRRCSCGRLFLWDEHQLPRDPLAPEIDPRSVPRWRWARRGSPETAQPRDAMPKAVRLTPAELEDALTQLDGTEGARFEGEVRLWCFWNRNRARAEGSEGAERQEPQDDNTARLLGLLPTDSEPAILVEGQALRDLGRFDEAAAVYARLPQDHRWRVQLMAFAERGQRDVTVLI